jgi:acyl carrier protein
MTENQIRAVVLEALSEPLARAGLDPAGLHDDFPLFESGLIDSFGFLNLITALEEKLGIAVDFDGLSPEEFTQLGGFIRSLAAKRG